MDFSQIANAIYDQSCSNSSDINEHVPTLMKYAKECSSVVEMGVRGGVSTIGFIKGLYENNREEKQYTGVDLYKYPQVEAIQNLSEQLNIRYNYIVGDSAKIECPETDLLFIDTWHIYGHLIRELRKHHSKVHKYIIMHDTTVDEILGESIRCRMNIIEQHQTSGYPIHEITKGLWPAIEEFLKENNEWRIKERFTNNNGLTILERII